MTRAQVIQQDAVKRYTHLMGGEESCSFYAAGGKKAQKCFLWCLKSGRRRVMVKL